jgi:hypothetical protein
MARNIRLTKKREKYVDQRSSGKLVGGALRPSAGQIERYSAEITKLLRLMYREYRAELVKTFDDTPAIVMDASIANKASVALNALKRRFARLFRECAPVIVEHMLKGVDKASTDTLNTSLKELSGGITLKTDKMPAALKQVVQSAIKENVALIKSIGEKYHTQIEGSVMRSLQPGGRGLADVREFLDKYEGITDRRRDLIAMNQVRRVSAAIQVEKAKSAGVKEFVWRHSRGGAHPREIHERLDGKVFTLDNLPVIDKDGTRGLPGSLPNCHPGDSSVHITNGCMKLYRRRYAGELVTLVSDDGVILKATPNHPVLTGRGWIAAKDVNLGDDLIQSGNQSIMGLETDVQNSISRFDKVFDLARLLIVHGQSYTGSTGLEFHGDISASDVDVVDAAGFLGDGFNAEIAKVLSEVILAYADPMRERGFYDGTPDEFFVSPLLSSDGSVSGFGSLLSGLWTGELSADDVLLGLRSRLDVVFPESASYHDAADSIFFGKADNCLTGKVLGNQLICGKLLACWMLGGAFDDGVSIGAQEFGEMVSMSAEHLGNLPERSLPVHKRVRVSKKFSSVFDSHVYNLETVSNWYVVNGIITHNCRCFMVPQLSWGDDE